MDRFTVAKPSGDRILNKRQAELKLFCDRMPSLSPALIASKMAHIPTGELHETYEAISKNARNFTALWRWHFMPKKDADAAADR